MILRHSNDISGVYVSKHITNIHILVESPVSNLHIIKQRQWDSMSASIHIHIEVESSESPVISLHHQVE